LHAFAFKFQHFLLIITEINNWHSGCYYYKTGVMPL